MKNVIFLLLTCFIISISCTSTVKESKVHSSQITKENIIKEANTITHLRSLLVSTNGELKIESYFKPYSGDSLDHVRSVTKSITSLLIGIAIDKKYIKSVDVTIDNFLEKKYPEHREKLRKISIADLLTMSSGLQWDESDVSEFNGWVRSRDPIDYVLQRKLKHTPGKKFEYNSGGSHLLSAVLTEATGINTFEFANQNLFEPLEIKPVRWTNIRPYYNGGAGLELRPGDMRRIGEMLISEGVYKGKQIVSEEWVTQSIKAHIKVSSKVAYGYSWWIFETIPEKVAAALGYGGQFIVVLPERETVLTASSNWRSLGQNRAGKTQLEISKLMESKIYPYLKILEEQAIQ